MYMHTTPLIKLSNFRKRKIHIAHHWTPNIIFTSILSHASNKTPESACKIMLEMKGSVDNILQKQHCKISTLQKLKVWDMFFSPRMTIFSYSFHMPCHVSHEFCYYEIFFWYSDVKFIQPISLTNFFNMCFSKTVKRELFWGIVQHLQCYICHDLPSGMS